MLPSINVQADPNTFEPAMFSLPELRFLSENMKLPPSAAFHNFDPEGKHRGVIRVRAEAALVKFSQLAELEQYRQVPWAGYAAIQESIERYLLWFDRTAEIERRGGPPNASQFMWDDTGTPHRYAIGSDAGELVRTEILDNGDRRAFGVKLTLAPGDALKADLKDIAPWIKSPVNELTKADKIEFTTIKRQGICRCPICGKTEEFDAADRTKRTAARARMARHLKTATVEVNRHRMLYTREFR